MRRMNNLPESVVVEVAVENNIITEMIANIHEIFPWKRFIDFFTVRLKCLHCFQVIFVFTTRSNSLFHVLRIHTIIIEDCRRRLSWFSQWSSALLWPLRTFELIKDLLTTSRSRFQVVEATWLETVSREEHSSPRGPRAEWLTIYFIWTNIQTVWTSRW